MDQAQFAIAMGVPTLAVLIGILVNNSRLGDVNNRISDLQRHMDSRIDNLIRLMDARFDAAKQELVRVEQVLDARLSHLEQSGR